MEDPALALQIRPGVIEITKGLKALPVLAEYPSSIPSTHVVGHDHPVLGDLTPILTV